MVCGRIRTHDFILVFCYSVDDAHLLQLQRVKCTGVHMQDGKHVGNAHTTSSNSSTVT